MAAVAGAPPAAAGTAAGIDAAAAVGRAMPELRPRFGIEAGYYWQEQPYEISNIVLTINNLPADLPVQAIDNEIEHAHLKFDWDVLPFLNLFAMAGTVEGTTTVQIAPPFPPFPPVDYDGWVYGLGTTAMVGGERWFAALTAIYTVTDLDVTGLDSSDKQAVIVMPKAGLVFGRFTAWVGLMYQWVEEEHSGSVAYPPPYGIIDFDIKLQQAEDWSYLVGANYAFNEHWNLTVEAGFGERESAMVALQWRF